MLTKLRHHRLSNVIIYSSTDFIIQILHPPIIVVNCSINCEVLVSKQVIFKSWYVYEVHDITQFVRQTDAKLEDAIKTVEHL